MLSHFKELYRYRALVWVMTERELKARYRGSLLGFLWTFMNPLLLMAVYALVFSVYLRMQVENYVVFLFAGLLPWLWFSSSLSQGVTSIISGGSLVTKVMFPPQVLPAVSVLSNLVNFLLTVPLMLIFNAIYHVPLGLPLLSLPIVVLVQLLFTHGLVLFVSSLDVHFRDLQYLVSNVLTFWFFFTPIIYPVSFIPEKYRFLFMINPSALLSQAYQNIFYNNVFPNLDRLCFVGVFSILLLYFGSMTFERFRESFAEEL